MGNNIYIYIMVMAIVTYLIRVLPLALIKKEIKNVTIRSFLHYVPYATLAAMTFPAILDSTSSKWSAAAGFAAALVLSYKEKGLFTVAGAACLVVFIVERIGW